MKVSTTACHIFRSLVKALDKAGVDWSRAVSFAVDGAPSKVGRNASVAKNFREEGRSQTQVMIYGYLFVFCT